MGVRLRRTHSGPLPRAVVLAALRRVGFPGSGAAAAHAWDG
ncbi:hypothetical protein CTATCC11996_07198 [Comamonas testosteroni ATCC 11996]|nr:hypothetical protein CTATCC11996_07198 [Comamonas testosteroni ATCC 11996]